MTIRQPCKIIVPPAKTRKLIQFIMSGKLLILIILFCDREKLRWWAQFLESSGEMDAALEHYARAGDYLSLVRLHCYLGDLERATELAEQSQDPAACFHVARQHESNDNISDALKFFGQAGAFGNAVRLCKVLHFFWHLKEEKNGLIDLD